MGNRRPQDNQHQENNPHRSSRHVRFVPILLQKSPKERPVAP